MVYLDLDGVFADYKQGFREVLGIEYHDEPKQAWTTLDKVPQLFSRLKPLPGALSLFSSILSLVSKYNDSCAILTALPRVTNELHSAAADKRQWVATNLSTNIRTIVVPGWQYKQFYCRNMLDILIDDSPRNIKAWELVGGKGILHKSNLTLCILEDALKSRVAKSG